MCVGRDQAGLQRSVEIDGGRGAGLERAAGFAKLRQKHKVVAKLNKCQDPFSAHFT